LTPDSEKQKIREKFQLNFVEKPEKFFPPVYLKLKIVTSNRVLTKTVDMQDWFHAGAHSINLPHSFHAFLGGIS
jgi:hypothetical protein